MTISAYVWTLALAFVAWAWIEFIRIVYALREMIPGPLHLFG